MIMADLGGERNKKKKGQKKKRSANNTYDPRKPWYWTEYTVELMGGEEPALLRWLNEKRPDGV